MTNYHLLCVDPGKGTGVVWMNYRNGTAAWIQKAENLELSPFEMFGQVVDWFESFSDQDEPWFTGKDEKFLVICESWEARINDFLADPNYSCQLIGAVKVACSMYGIELRMQSPKYRTAVDEIVYRRSPYWVSGSADHHRQAVRHGLAYLVEELHHQPTMEAIHPRKR